MSNAHTQGSWEVGYGDGLYGPRVSPTVYMDGNGFLEIPIRVGKHAVAWILSSSPDGKEDADARLIAAAPALLEELDPDTLEAIANEIDCFQHSARAASLRILAKRQRAAIAKATGERA